VEIESPFSVVVAAHGTDRLARCLAAYAREARPGDEILAVVATDRDPAAEIRFAPPGVRLLRARPGDLTPRLWALGLKEARGELVQLTIAPCLPEAGWRRAAARAQGDDVAAVGGAIEPGASLRLRDWAILFLRYRAYLPPFDRHPVRDVPGDNATYRRAVLEELRALWGREFWEQEVNAELARRGRPLVMDPTVVVRYEGGEGVRAFLRQRLRHGVRFGRMRLVGAPPWRRLVFSGAFLLPGAALLLKVAGSVLKRPRFRGPFLTSLPCLCLFLLAWSWGAWWGYVLGPPSSGGVDPQSSS